MPKIAEAHLRSSLTPPTAATQPVFPEKHRNWRCDRCSDVDKGRNTGGEGGDVNRDYNERVGQG